jgi:hypothetical protein
MKRTVGTAGVFGVLLGAALVVAPSSGAAPAQAGCDTRTNNTYQKLLECVRLDGVVEHMEKLQAIADANGGNRADQTSGYQASVDYVVKTLEDAGWSADVVPFTYDAADVILKQLTPVAANYIALDAAGTGEGDVTGTVIPVDINLAGDAPTAKAARPDFAGLDFSGSATRAVSARHLLVLVKAQNANAGAEAVVLFNQGDPSAGDRFGR